MAFNSKGNAQDVLEMSLKITNLRLQPNGLNLPGDNELMAQTSNMIHRVLPTNHAQTSYIGGFCCVHVYKWFYQ